MIGMSPTWLASIKHTESAIVTHETTPSGSILKDLDLVSNLWDPAALIFMVSFIGLEQISLDQLCLPVYKIRIISSSG